MGLAVQMTGALLVLGAFALLQLKVLSPTSLAYLLLNAVGSATLAGNAGVNGQWGFVVLNVVWFAVSLAGLARVAAGLARGQR
jgi:hypothetical protein